MQKLTVSLLAAVLATTAFATTPAAAMDSMSQQDRMKMCNQDATGKKGDERKAFMSQCLSARKVSQQDKMKTCNKDAAGKKGDERKAFMSDCLKG